MIRLETTLGNIDIELDHENTPNTAENFLRYVKEGFYDDTIFHRVINDFMIQGGGFDNKMEQKDGFDPIENEAEHCQANTRGTLAMARTMAPHSASSQFFINVKDNPFLNFQSKDPQGYGYCVFGKVITGMDVVDQIKVVETTTKHGHQDVPVEDVVLTKASIVDETVKAD